MRSWDEANTSISRLFYAYIGIGQAVDIIENQKKSYEFTLEEARKRKNKRALRELKNLKPPFIENINHLRIQRKWLARFGGSLHNYKNLKSLAKCAFDTPEYSFIDFIKYLLGSRRSIRTIWKNHIRNVKFLDEITEVKVPVYFCGGRYDYTTPSELAEKYLEVLKAPYKEFIWFEYSAHSPNYEEPEKFNDLLVNQVLPRHYKQGSNFEPKQIIDFAGKAN